VRGSSLAYPPVLESLRPFIVTYASARHVEDFPPDVRDLCAQAGHRKNINLGLMVLDQHGKMVRQTTPFVRPPAFNFDPEAQGKDFKRQIDQLLEGLPIPAAKIAVRPRITLPDVPGTEPLAGVRIYLTFGANKLNHYRTPTVEAVATPKELRRALVYPATATKVSADAVKPWLEQIYPPAIMDGKGGFDRIDATLTLRPAGTIGEVRCAVLEGDVQFALDNASRIRYDGKLSVVVEYDGDNPVRVRGICECVFPKTNPQGQVVERIAMTATIESRPR